MFKKKRTVAEITQSLYRMTDELEQLEKDLSVKSDRLEEEIAELKKVQKDTASEMDKAFKVASNIKKLMGES